MDKPCIDCIRMKHSDKSKCEFKPSCDWLYWYQQGKEDTIDEFIKAIEKHQTRQDSYLDPHYVEMGLDMTDVLEVAEQLKEKEQ